MLVIMLIFRLSVCVMIHEIVNWTALAQITSIIHLRVMLMIMTAKLAWRENNY